MTSKDLYRELGNIDPAMIEVAAPAEKIRSKKRNAWTKWVSTAACFCLVFTVSLIIALGNFFAPAPIDPPYGSAPSPDGGTGGVQIPDKVYTFNANEKMNCLCGKCYAIFEHLYLTSTIGDITDSEGGYLIFVATVYTDHHFLDANEIILDTELFDPLEFAFSETLSEQLSDTKNAFDCNTTNLSGRICFVFAINADAYNKLFTAIENETSLDSLILSPYMSWHGGRCLFAFTSNNIDIITKYN